MDHPYQPNKFMTQKPANFIHITYGVEEASCDNMQISQSELISYIVTSQLSRVAKSKVKQEVIMPDPFVTKIKTEANPYVEGIKIKLKPTKESNTNANAKIELEPTEEISTEEDIKIKLKNEIPTCNETNILSNETLPKQFDCELCDYSCAHEGKLKKHKKTHMNMKICNICKFVTRTNRRLNLHIINTHKGEKPYKCTLCEFRAPMQNLLNKHCKTHKGNIFQCELCNFRALGINELLISQHMKKHEVAKIFKCNLCEYKSLKNNKYNRHMKKHEVNEIESGEYNIYFKSTLKELMVLNSGKKKCSICKLTFRKQKLENHMKVHVTKELLELTMRRDKWINLNKTANQPLTINSDENIIM